jgi:hypothetical protein
VCLKLILRIPLTLTLSYKWRGNVTERQTIVPSPLVREG